MRFSYYSTSHDDEIEGTFFSTFLVVCCFILFWEALTTAKQNYSIKITILCVSLKNGSYIIWTIFAEDKNEREWRRKARDSGDLEVKTSISNFVWQPQQQGILRTYAVPVNYKCAFLWHVTSSLIVKFILHTISFHLLVLRKNRIVFLFYCRIVHPQSRSNGDTVSPTLYLLTINFNKSNWWLLGACKTHLFDYLIVFIIFLYLHLSEANKLQLN